ncbi:hypothetical protein BDZ89DRAFT_1039503 [Hymenopellis radicata]|nr:hypothetical protein BDZ89DRAFT_1039503 [Hymenopellis radicata]
MTRRVAVSRFSGSFLIALLSSGSRKGLKKTSELDYSLQKNRVFKLFRSMSFRFLFLLGAGIGGTNRMAHMIYVGYVLPGTRADTNIATLPPCEDRKKGQKECKGQHIHQEQNGAKAPTKRSRTPTESNRRVWENPMTLTKDWTLSTSQVHIAWYQISDEREREQRVNEIHTTIAEYGRKGSTRCAGHQQTKGCV